MTRWRTFCVALGLSVGLAAAVQAKSVGPDAYGYVAGDVPFAWEDISDQLTRTHLPGTGSEDTAVTWTLGFTFNFYGQSFTDVSWSDNGLVTLGGTNNQFGNVDLASSAPSSDIPSIAVLWDDWSARPEPGSAAAGELPLKDGVYDHPIDALRYFFVNHTRPTKTTTRHY